MAADETTPLIRPAAAAANGSTGSSHSSGGDGGVAAPRKSRWAWGAALNVENRILLAGFLITLSFSFTQVP